MNKLSYTYTLLYQHTTAPKCGSFISCSYPTFTNQTADVKDRLLNVNQTASDHPAQLTVLLDKFSCQSNPVTHLYLTTSYTFPATLSGSVIHAQFFKWVSGLKVWLLLDTLSSNCNSTCSPAFHWYMALIPQRMMVDITAILLTGGFYYNMVNCIKSWYRLLIQQHCSPRAPEGSPPIFSCSHAVLLQGSCPRAAQACWRQRSQQ